MSTPINPIEVDPHQLQEDLIERLQRYLLTALPIHRRFPKLRAAAQAKLDNPASLVKGPFLEALPDFKKKNSLAGLVEEGGGVYQIFQMAIYLHGE